MPRDLDTCRASGWTVLVYNRLPLTRPTVTTRRTVRPRRGVFRVGCVRYLNARPLIEGLGESLKGLPRPSICLDVPSRLAEQLEAGRVDLALCPVIDYHRSRVPLEIVPVGGISCFGPTMTVRLFSKIPINRIREVHADSDSHTSVALLQVVLSQMNGSPPAIVPYDAQAKSPRPTAGSQPTSLLLIGDKVVTACPSGVDYPCQLDLGEAWHELTGRPFVFAVWMTRLGADLGPLPELLRRRLGENLGRLDTIAARSAPRFGWDEELAKRYLTQLMRYEIGPEEVAAMHLFCTQAHALGLLNQLQPLRVRWQHAA